MRPLGLGAASTQALADAADENFVVHGTTVARALAGMSVRDEGGVVVVDSGLPCDTFNLVLRARLSPDEAPARAREVCGYFARKRRPFSWWVGPADRPATLGDALLEAGLARSETELAMAADLSLLDEHQAPPAELRIARVRSERELADFARINAANWTPPDVQVVRFYELGAGVLLGAECPLWLYVGYLGELAVATAELAVGPKVAGLYNIATLASRRRRGFGSAMTLQPLLDARAAGYRTAVLQASADGQGLYARLGFRPFGEITEYQPTG